MYKSKYLKYKKKYIDLQTKIGGKVLTFSNKEPILATVSEYIPHFLTIPLRFYSGSYYLNNRLIRKKDSDFPKYYINDKFELEEKLDDFENSIFIESNFKFLNDKIININDTNQIPFNILFLQKKFNILSNLKLFIDEHIPEHEKQTINYVINKLFIFGDDNEYINISQKPNILSKYIFINKIFEFLKLLYDDGDLPNISQTKTKLDVLCSNNYPSNDLIDNIKLKIDIYNQENEKQTPDIITIIKKKSKGLTMELERFKDKLLADRDEIIYTNSFHVFIIINYNKNNTLKQNG